MLNFNIEKIEDRNLNQVLKSFKEKFFFSDSVIIPENCLIALLKSDKLLVILTQLMKFFESQQIIYKYANKIF